MIFVRVFLTLQVLTLYKETSGGPAPELLLFTKSTKTTPDSQAVIIVTAPRNWTNSNYYECSITTNDSPRVWLDCPPLQDGQNTDFISALNISITQEDEKRLMNGFRYFTLYPWFTEIGETLVAVRVSHMDRMLSENNLTFHVVEEREQDAKEKCSVKLINVGPSVTKPDQLRRKDSLTITSVLDSDCPVISEKVYYWFLRPVKDSNTTTTTLKDVRLNESYLVIPALSLDYGVHEVRLIVKGNRMKGRMETEGKGWLDVKASRLEPMIEGGPNLLFPWRNELILNASRSYDPDNPGGRHLRFNWSCSAPNDQEFCEKRVFFKNKPVIRIPPKSLQRKTNYLFTLELLSSLRRDPRAGERVTQRIATAGSKSFKLEIECLNNCDRSASPLEGLVLLARCILCSSKPDYWWSFRSSRNNTKQRLDWSTESIFSRENPLLSIRRSVLRPGETYVFRLKGKLGPDKSRALYVVTMNKPPEGGKCQVKPISGAVLLTLFSVKCTGFTDEDEPLVYDFHYNDDYAEATKTKDVANLTQMRRGLNLRLRSSSFVSNLVLPAGDPKYGYKGALRVIVYDNRELYTEVLLTVKVYPPRHIPPSRLKSMVMSQGFNTSGLDASVMRGDYEGSLSTIMAVASLIDTRKSTKKRLVPLEEAAEMRWKMQSILDQVPVYSLHEAVQFSATLESLIWEVPTQQLKSLPRLLDRVVTEVEKGIQDSHNTFVKVLEATSTSLDCLSALLLESSKSSSKDIPSSSSSSLSSFTNDQNLTHTELSNKNIFQRGEVALSAFLMMEKLAKCLGGRVLRNQGPRRMSTRWGKILIWLDVRSSLDHNTWTLGTENGSRIVQRSFGDPNHVESQVLVSDLNPYFGFKSTDEVNCQFISVDARSTGHLTEKEIRDFQLFIKAKDDTLLETSEQSFFISPNGDPVVHGVYLKGPIMKHQEILHLTFTNIPNEAKIMVTGKCGADTNHSLEMFDFARHPLLVPSSNISLQNGTMKVVLFDVSLPPPLLDLKLDMGDLHYCQIGILPLTVQNINRLSDLYDEISDILKQVGNPWVLNQRGENFSLSVQRVRCLSWNNSVSSWTPEGCTVQSVSSSGVVECRCGHLSSFTANLLQLPNQLDLSATLQLLKTVSTNPVVMVTVSVVWLLYFVLLPWTVWTDNRQPPHKRYLHILETNIPKTVSSTSFIITVFTGIRPGSGTSAQVYLELIGNLRASGPLCLTGLGALTLQTGGMDHYLLTCNLGNDIRSIIVFHDNSGVGPAWFLKRIVIEEVSGKGKWYFSCSVWVSLRKGLRYTFTPDISEKSHWGKFKEKYLWTLRDNHLWMSVLARPPQSAFLCSHRLTCALVLLLLGMLSNIMFYGITVKDPEGKLRLGDFRLTVLQLLIGLRVTLIVFPITFAIGLLFRQASKSYCEHLVSTSATGIDNNGGPAPLPGSVAESKTSGSLLFELLSYPDGVPIQSQFLYLMDKEAPHRNNTSAVLPSSVPLPPSTERVPEKKKGDEWYRFHRWGLYFTWILSLTVSLVCSFFVILYGLSYGYRRSMDWLASFMTTVAQDVLICQPIIVCIFAARAVFFRKNSADEVLGSDLLSSHAPRESLTAPSPPRLVVKSLLWSQEVRERRLASLLREALGFAFLSLPLLVLVYTERDPERSFHFAEALRKTLGFHEASKVSTLPSWFSYMNDILLPSLSLNSMYNGNQVSASEVNFMSDMTSVLVGVPRITNRRVLFQEHVVTDIVEMDDLSETIISRPDWSSQREPPKALEEMFHYKKELEGYPAILSRSLSESRFILKYLMASKWLDVNATSRVTVDIFCYNPSLDLLASAKLTFIYSPPVGSCVKVTQELTVMPRPYLNVGRVIIEVFAFLLFLTQVFCCLRWSTTGKIIFCIVLAATIIGSVVSLYFRSKSSFALLEAGSVTESKFISLEDIATWENWLRVTDGLLVALITLDTWMLAGELFCPLANKLPTKSVSIPLLGVMGLAAVCLMAGSWLLRTGVTALQDPENFPVVPIRRLLSPVLSSGIAAENCRQYGSRWHRLKEMESGNVIVVLFGIFFLAFVSPTFFSVLKASLGKPLLQGSARKLSAYAIYRTKRALGLTKETWDDYEKKK